LTGTSIPFHQPLGNSPPVGLSSPAAAHEQPSEVTTPLSAALKGKEVSRRDNDTVHPGLSHALDLQVQLGQKRGNPEPEGVRARGKANRVEVSPRSADAMTAAAGRPLAAPRGDSEPSRRPARQVTSGGGAHPDRRIPARPRRSEREGELASGVREDGPESPSGRLPAPLSNPPFHSTTSFHLLVPVHGHERTVISGVPSGERPTTLSRLGTPR
jgi:hypothetical protein